tara:strand:- start:150 stop:1268 length:1119 start_codon:yes stop_codon:yes gene_type:complete
MKTILSILTILLLSNLVVAQTTVIPDTNFEQALIDLGLDSGTVDGVVITANIDTLTNLDVHSKSISDLTGIEDFIALTELNCSQNQLTSLDVTQNTNLFYLKCNYNALTSLDVTQNISLTNLWCNFNALTNLDITKNTALISLWCGNNNLISLDVSHNLYLITLSPINNQLTNLDVSQNTALTSLTCGLNQLTNLDVSQNTALTSLWCDNNQLTNLDVSQNTVLTSLWCQANLLECLNGSNGNNTSFTYFVAYENPSLTCIKVDNLSYSTANWTSSIDAQTSFSNNCGPCTVSINEYSISNFNIYPNPTTNQLTIDSELAISKVSIVDLTGKTIKTHNQLASVVDVADLPNGIYFIQIIAEEGTITKKFIKQ